MGAVITALRDDAGFQAIYDPDEMRGMGERNHLTGLAPLDLFLKTLGIRFYSQRKLSVRGVNPFPWPVKVRWKGVQVECLDKVTSVRFPDGLSIEITGSDQQMVERAHTSEE
jgi:hypothetical protein